MRAREVGWMAGREGSGLFLAGEDGEELRFPLSDSSPPILVGPRWDRNKRGRFGRERRSWFVVVVVFWWWFRGRKLEVPVLVEATGSVTWGAWKTVR